MKKSILLIGAIIVLWACNNTTENQQNSTVIEADSADINVSQATDVFVGVYADWIDFTHLSFEFYYEKDGILQTILIKDNGQSALELLRNPQSYGLLFEVTCSKIYSEIEEREQFYADTVISIKQISGNNQLTKRVKQEIWQEYGYDMENMSMPIAINMESFDTYDAQAMLLPNNMYWIFLSSDVQFIDVRKEYDLTEGFQYQPETEISFHGKIPESFENFDLFLMSELPLRVKLGAEGEARTYYVYSVSNGGDIIAKLKFARDFTLSDNLMYTGVMEENLIISLTETTFDENQNEVLNYENKQYSISTKGEFIATEISQ